LDEQDWKYMLLMLNDLGFNAVWLNVLEEQLARIIRVKEYDK
jgi:hypothetical protein